MVEEINNNINNSSDSSEIVEKKIQKNKNKLFKLFFGGLTIGALFFLLLLYYFVSVGVQNLSERDLIVKSAQLFNYPVVKVNNNKVLYSDYIRDIRAYNKFLESQEAGGIEKPTAEQVKNEVVSKLMVNALFEGVAKEYGIKLTKEELETEKKNLLANFKESRGTADMSDEEVESKLKTELVGVYGLSLEDFIKSIIIPNLLQKKVQETVENNPKENEKKYEVDEIKASHILFKVDNGEKEEKVKTEAEAVLAKAKSGEDFSELAKKYSEDTTKENGGDLGWFAKGRMVPEFENVAFSLKKDEVSTDLVKSQFGFHIIKIYDQRKKVDFGKFMTEKLKTAKYKFYSSLSNPFDSFIKQLEEQESQQDVENK